MNRWASRISALLSVLVIMQLFGIANTASAHALSASFTTLSVEPNGIDMKFAIDDLSVIESTKVDTNQNGQLEKTEMDAAKMEIAEWIGRNVVLKVNGIAKRGEVKDMQLEEKQDRLMVATTFHFAGAAAGQKVTLDDALYANDTKTSYANLFVFKQGESVSEAVLKGSNRHWEGAIGGAQTTPSNSDAAAAEPGSGTRWWDFFVLGMEHIITGYDHLLFLLALLLRKQTFKQYAAIITAFTLAHSLTLTLAVLGVVSLPSKVVEIIIAVSICYVAIENMVRESLSYRALLTFAFGLIHGLGFAGILMEMEIPKSHLAVSLISFNVGIEAVQITLAALLLPLLGLWYKSANHKLGLRIGSSLIVLIGALWVVERIVS
ncbi:HupE/UreJ family protein [Paenibacillus chartarius]|uniref:HupE/UreJ family protein n=1 Tax=Paenibacillus chartarius TaxID=747481 RepID=A0ABV6DLF7_9BACL